MERVPYVTVFVGAVSVDLREYRLPFDIKSSNTGLKPLRALNISNNNNNNNNNNNKL